VTKGTPRTQRQRKQARASATKPPPAAPAPQKTAKAPPARTATQPKGERIKGKLSAADLLAGCRKMIEKSTGMPSSKVEAMAQDRLYEYEAEVNLGREVQTAAEALNHAILEAMKIARRCRRSPCDNFSHLVRRFVAPFIKSRHELKRLSWRPQRESNKPITCFVEAVDRTNFLGLVDRPATDQEMACLVVVLEVENFQDTELKTSLSATLRRIVNAVHKCRCDKYHGRPALIEKTQRDIAKRLRELAAKGVEVPRAKRVYYL